ncbi:MAG: AtzE family amidohydrolase [Burkholderiales bacterium]
MIGAEASATAIARSIGNGTASAVEVTRAALARIDAHNAELNAFTAVTRAQALADAAAIDAKRARGEALPFLAGVPFAVKNLYDIAGVTTIAGSKIHATQPPAERDATLVARLRAAGAVLVGALNMDEYAYGFTTENTHYGATRNPHDPERIAGGSSGGSAAAVAAGLVPLTLGSDTNGSIRVPASLCGVFGLKPTFGRLSRHGAFLFAASFDHVGPLARSVTDIAAAYDAMQGPDPADVACAQRPIEATLDAIGDGIQGLRCARLGGYFEENAGPEAREAVEIVATALRIDRVIEFPETHRARAAAVVITAAEGANLHLPNIKTRLEEFDPVIRDRFLAGALIPSMWTTQAQRFRHWYRAQVMTAFRDVDLLIAGATPWTATRIGQEITTLNGQEALAKPMVGVLTQPLSFVGLPVLTVPVIRPGRLPIGVQLIAAPWREDLVLRAGFALEADGIVAAAVASALMTTPAGKSSAS